MGRTSELPTPDVASAWQALDAEVSRLGHLVPCVAMPGAHVSDDYRERAEAAQACEHCPALDACARFADVNGESWHVWAGRDRTTDFGARRKAGA